MSRSSNRRTTTRLAYAEQFIGLGDPFAPFWFVWNGPGFPNLPGGTDLAGDDEEATEWYRFERFRLLSAIERWSEHPRAVCRLEDLYNELTGSRYPYRATVAAIAEDCRGGPASLDEPDAIEPDVFRAELFPLGVHGLEELGTPAILAPYMHSRRAYAAYRRIQRLHASAWQSQSSTRGWCSCSAALQRTSGWRCPTRSPKLNGSNEAMWTGSSRLVVCTSPRPPQTRSL